MPQRNKQHQPSKSLDISAVGQAIGVFFERFQNIVFFILLGVAIAVAILMIIDIYSTKPSEQIDTPPLITNSQKKTAESLQKLESSESPKDLSAPSGRFSPFFEGGWDANIIK